MYRCNICNTEYKRECDFTRHLNACKIKENEHKDLLLKHRQCKVDKVYNGDVILLTDYYQIDGKSLSYVDIHNNKCGHDSTLTFGSLLNGQSCAHPECISETKRRAMKELLNSRGYIVDDGSECHYHKTKSLNTGNNDYEPFNKYGSPVDTKDPSYREFISRRVREALKDPVKRMNRLRGQAEVQRNNDSPYEAMFIGVLTKYKINYDYQIPMIIRDVGCIIDFYLPDYETYVNVNSDIFHWMQDDKIHGEFKESAHAVQRKDKLLRKVFREEGLIYKEVYSYDDMIDLIHNLIQEGR